MGWPEWVEERGRWQWPRVQLVSLDPAVVAGGPLVPTEAPLFRELGKGGWQALWAMQLGPT